ncbi:phage related protein [Lactobacillus phage phiAQ113]|uniref:phage related protein n=1 Tax=Lactobacillus phage phiAQ113 TaxID=1206110 RepID=UPI00029FFD19|nr:phage related protein [Lactobacillus phage phiAQ113]CCI88344.1 phage related protein [Lactobacillus phage phiAQ113]
MADETNTPVAGTENATQNAEVDTSVKTQEESLKKNFPTLIGYLYMSDPDNTNPLWHHYVMPVFDEKAYENLPWHVYKERPSDDLVDPLYSVQKGGWIENAHDAQTQILAQVQMKIDAIDKSKKQLDQTLKSVQENQLTGTTQTLALTKSIKELSEGQANQSKLLASLQNLMLTIAGSQKTAKPTAPTQATTATATDKQ